MTRRTVLGTAAVAGLSVPALTSPAFAAKRAAPRLLAALPQIAAGQADALVDSVGVNTHFNWRLTEYGQTDRVVQAVRDLGVRHIRDRIVPSEESRQAFSALAGYGVRVQGVCGALGDSQTMSDAMSEVLSHYADPTKVFSAFEGINEPNNDGVPWIDETRAKTRDLFDQRNAAGLRSIPILGPALARVNSGGVEGDTTEIQSANLGSLADVIDIGNVHVYPRQQIPSADIDRFVAYQRLICGDLPIVCSEGGYFTAMKYEGGAWPTPEDVVGKYLPRLVLEHALRSTRRYFVYELMDRYDPTDSVRLSSFGLVGVPDADPGASWVLKPGFAALRNLLSVMADPGGEHSVGGLAIGVKGPADLRYKLFSKRDGSRYLALWRDVSCYDPATRTRLNVSSQSVTLSFGVRRRVSLYRPTVSDLPEKNYASSTSAKVPVADELVIARIS